MNLQFHAQVPSRHVRGPPGLTHLMAFQYAIPPSPSANWLEACAKFFPELPAMSLEALASLCQPKPEEVYIIRRRLKPPPTSPPSIPPP